MVDNTWIGVIGAVGGGALVLVGTLGTGWLQRDQETKSRREKRAFARADQQRETLVSTQLAGEAATAAIALTIGSFRTKPLPSNIAAIEADAQDKVRHLVMVNSRSSDSEVRALGLQLMLAGMRSIEVARESREKTDPAVFMPVQEKWVEIINRTSQVLLMLD